MYNPYLPLINPMPNMAPQMEIQKVTGEESVRAFPMGPNSSAILLDTTNPLVWVVTTDASGFKTIQPYSITPYTPEKPLAMSDIQSQFDTLNDRLTKLEERMNSRGQPNHGNAWKNNRQSAQPDVPNGENGG